MENDNRINRNEEEKNRHLYALNELDDYEVDDNDPDVRGWDVLDEHGNKMGKVEELIVDPKQMKVRYLVVDVETSMKDGGRSTSSVDYTGSDSDLSKRSKGSYISDQDDDSSRSEGFFSQNKAIEDDDSNRDVGFGNSDYDKAKDRSMETRSSAEMHGDRNIGDESATGGGFDLNDRDRTGDLHKSGRSAGDASEIDTSGLGDSNINAESDRDMETRTSADFGSERDTNSGIRMDNEESSLETEPRGAARASDLDSNFGDRDLEDTERMREENLAEVEKNRDRDVNRGRGFHAGGNGGQDNERSGSERMGSQQNKEKRLLIPIGYAKLDEEDDKVLIQKLDFSNIHDSPEYGGGPVSRDYETKLRKYLDKDMSTDSENSYSSNEFYNHQHFDESMFKSARNPRRGQKGTGDYLNNK